MSRRKIIIRAKSISRDTEKSLIICLIFLTTLTVFLISYTLLYAGNKNTMNKTHESTYFSPQYSVNRGNIFMYWQVVQEETNVYFVQRSDDSYNYYTIGFIQKPDIRKNGNVLSYHFIDRDPFQGENWYRLIEIDNMGREMVKDPFLILYSHDLQ